MLDPIIGAHPALRHVKLQLPVLAASYEPLLVIGEHGTGKTLLAKTIHSRSPFSSSKLITVDCSLLGDRDQLDFLFGDKPPAQRSPLESQITVVVKNPNAGCVGFRELLVHALKTREVWDYRSGRYVPIAARIILILTLHSENAQMIPDLDPHLAELFSQYETITIPSLARRKYDIPRLAKHFIRQEAAKGRVIRGVDEKLHPTRWLLKLLMRHRWHGNVIELKAFVRRLAVHTPEDLLRSLDHQAVEEARMMIEERKGFDIGSTVSRVKSTLVAHALTNNKNKQLPTSFLLGISRRSVHRSTRNPAISRS